MGTWIITGGSSGLGAAIKHEMENWAYAPGEDREIIDWSLPHVNVTNAGSITQAIADLGTTKIEGLINCAGVNMIDYLPDIKEADWDDVMAVNAKGIFLVTQQLLEPLRGGTVCNIVSNAARVPMTASAVYNASKGAALILTAQMARELLVTHDITVFSISPGKLAGTEMSQYIERRVIETRGWDDGYARAYQLSVLKMHEEIDPNVLAEFVAFLLSTKERHKYLHGQDILYGG